MSKISKLFILQFILTPLYTQKLKIQDFQTKEPLPGVNVFSSTYGTTTDTNGVCSLEKFSEKDEIVFSHIGYKMIQATKHNLSDNLYLTIASIPMDRVSVLSFKSTEEKKKFKKLERDVIKVYPYALLVGRLLGEYSDVLDSIESLSYFKRIGKKKKIFKSIEKQLISKYGNRVRKLTKKQGRILIRLIDRETNSTSYQIIKDFRIIFSAGFWQLTARIFRHNLKSKYTPESGEAKLIEHIIVNLKL